MASPAAAVPLGVLPRPSMGKVAVAVALELVPAVVTALRVFLAEAAPIAGEAKADERVDLVNAGASILTGAGDALININLTVLPGEALVTATAIHGAVDFTAASMQARVVFARIQGGLFRTPICRGPWQGWLFSTRCLLPEALHTWAPCQDLQLKLLWAQGGRRRGAGGVSQHCRLS